LALLLNIDTATEVASVCVSLNGGPVAFRENQNQREHAAFVHVAVESVLDEAGYGLRDMDAFAVTSGPGSYTGLRVGMATAKGFCFAFSKPLIAINTLEVMAKAALETLGETEKNGLLCPMIDARRMEVFTALYDMQLQNLLLPMPYVLEEKSFDNYMTKDRVIFFGSGSLKFQALKTGANAIFKQVWHSAKDLASLADQAFQQKKFSDVSYSEPQYFKDFHTLSKG
jgi:tRNA threonylcarbamoyladenosine biosynthesis protein TsaB